VKYVPNSKVYVRNFAFAKVPVLTDNRNRYIKVFSLLLLSNKTHFLQSTSNYSYLKDIKVSLIKGFHTQVRFKCHPKDTELV